MKRKTDIWILCIGLILLAAGLYLIRMDSDPEGILRVLPFVFIGFGCGLFGHGMGNIVSQRALKETSDFVRLCMFKLK